MNGRYYLRLLHNELRIGLHDGLIQEAIARASGTDLKTCASRDAFSFRPRRGCLDRSYGRHDRPCKQVDIKLFVPLLPMLSELSQDFNEIFTAHGGKTALEFKYDGARVQIHKDGESGPHLEPAPFRSNFEPAGNRGACTREIFKGILSFSTPRSSPSGKDGRPFPFQELMRRFKRVHGIESAASEIPLSLHLFDCLFFDGRSLIDEPYERAG